MSEKVQDAKDKSEILALLKGVLVSIVVTLVLVLLFALVVKLTSMGENAIKPINQLIKVIGIFVGCKVGIKDKSKGLVRGFILGLVITILSFLIFSIIAAKFTFTWMLVLDIAFGAMIGGICGIIIVNMKKAV